MNINDFPYREEELRLYRQLLAKYRPSLIAEFGSGLTTRIWAENPETHVISFDNSSEWIKQVMEHYAGEPWLDRVDFRLYEVTPQGDRSVEKDVIAWNGPPFEFVFIDGPRSAHPTSYGRHGSFQFAARYSREGACIVWHDYDRSHERALAKKYFRHCRCHASGRVGWCIWRKPEKKGLLYWLGRWKRQ
jgi:hypothetical protein